MNNISLAAGTDGLNGTDLLLSAETAFDAGCPAQTGMKVDDL